MAREFKRTDRVGSQMQRELASLLRSGLDTPALGMVTVQEVRVTSDFSYAKVYVTLLGNSMTREQSIKRLNEAAPELRHELGQVMRIRSLPKLQFVYDESIERGSELSHLIDQAIASDRRSDED